MIRNIHYSKQFHSVLLFDSEHKAHTIRTWNCSVGTELRHVINPYSPNRCVVMVNRCVSTQAIQLIESVRSIQLLEEGRFLTDAEIDALAYNDGFETTQDFWYYWRTKGTFKGYIIHWTRLRY